MKFLCLAYGDEKDWVELPEEEQQELLAADEVLRQRGALIAAVGEPTIVRAWDGIPETTSGTSFAAGAAPLVGFSVVEADSIDEVIQLVAKTPCAVARGAIEVRPFLDLG